MKKSRFAESRIIKILSEQEQGKSVTELCRAHVISQSTLYQWQSKYSGVISQLKKMEELEIELAQYKKMCLPELHFKRFDRKNALRLHLRLVQKREQVDCLYQDHKLLF